MVLLRLPITIEAVAVETIAIDAAQVALEKTLRVDNPSSFTVVSLMRPR
ncbi:MAG: hypothetical protein JO152_11810 [Mycobacteriaceae bacterium]|nr:hypothetical protein [Mycobacteriaceae bacterium]